MVRPRVWRNAILTLIALAAVATAWNNRFGPAASPYFHRNRLTGVECHRGVECWLPGPARKWPAPADQPKQADVDD